MLFSSVIFICFFLPAVILINSLLSFSRTAQNIFLFAAGLVFYAWGNPGYIFLMLISVIADYIFAILFDRTDDGTLARKALFVVSIVLNVGVLFVFKYLGFAVENLNLLLPETMKISIPGLVMPIGISFYTFKALSYLIEVYTHRAKADKNLINVGLYISFFPQLVAGPIVRYTPDTADQIRNRKASFKKFSAGCCRFAAGFAKKILLANSFAVMADFVYSRQKLSGSIPVLLAWTGAAAYALQIFFDFSSYSDMAIGIGNMLGFKTEENFNYPYISKSITEFWRRWHISLSTWFREYIYFPLGGSRLENQDKVIRNLFVVWLLTAVWHGSGWTFLIWGLWNFIFIFIEKLTDFEENSIPGWIKHIYLLWIVIMAWVPFRSADLQQTVSYIASMYNFFGGKILSSQALMLFREYWIYWMAGLILCTPFSRRVEKLVVSARNRVPAVISAVIYPAGLAVMFILAMSYLIRGSYTSFIYANF